MLALYVAMGWFTRQKTEDRALSAATVPPVMLTATPSGDRVNATTALTIADAYSCIRALADAAASLPLIVYRRTEHGRERIDNRTAQLLRNPAPAVTQAGLVGQMVAHLNLHGNCYVGKYRDGDGRIEQLGCSPRTGLPLRSKAGCRCTRFATTMAARALTPPATSFTSRPCPRMASSGSPLSGSAGLRLA